MRTRRLLVLLTGCGLYLGAVAAVAQAQGTHVDVHKGGVRVEAGVTGMQAMNARVVRAKDLTGLGVYNAANESLGKIEDLVIDPMSGRIRYAVLSFGGILGIGDKYFAVPWHAISFVPKGETNAGTRKEDYCILDVAKDTLKNAPGFDKDHWPNFADANWSATVDRFYGTHRQATGERNPNR
jgi:sporulation protein YlmC with PRC-barrel domain